MRRMYSEKQIEKLAEQVSEQVAKQIVQDDKDIISKIIVEYDQTYQVTYIKFPVGICPLAFTVTYNDVSYDLFTKEGYLVDDNGVNVIQIDEIYSHDTENYIALSGEHELEIHNISYLLYDKAGLTIKDTYFLFHPITESGTKLYNHTIVFEDDEANQFTLMLVSNIASQFTWASLYNALNSDLVYVKAQTTISINTSIIAPFIISDRSGELYLLGYDFFDGGTIGVYLEKIVSDSVAEI